MSDFARLGFRDNNNEFQPTNTRARDVIAINGVSAETHIMATNNPHSVTIGQVGGVSQANFDTQIATIEGLITAINTTLTGLQYIREATYTQATGDLTFTRRDNTTLTVNIPIAELIHSITYDAATQELVLTQLDNTVIRVSMSALVPIFVGTTGTHIQIAINSENEISAILRANSVTGAELANNIQLPGTPTIQTRPAANATGSEIVDAGWVNNRLTGVSANLDAAFVENLAAMQALNLRNNAVVLMRVQNV